MHGGEPDFCCWRKGRPAPTSKPFSGVQCTPGEFVNEHCCPTMRATEKFWSNQQMFSRWKFWKDIIQQGKLNCRPKNTPGGGKCCWPKISIAVTSPDGTDTSRATEGTHTIYDNPKNETTTDNDDKTKEKIPSNTLTA